MDINIYFFFHRAYEDGIDYFQQRGVTTTYIRLDNETSAAFEKMCKRKDVTIEYVPPGNHRGNIAEGMISTAKDHIFGYFGPRLPP